MDSLSRIPPTLSTHPCIGSYDRDRPGPVERKRRRPVHPTPCRGPEPHLDAASINDVPVNLDLGKQRVQHRALRGPYSNISSRRAQCNFDFGRPAFRHYDLRRRSGGEHGGPILEREAHRGAADVAADERLELDGGHDSLAVRLWGDEEAVVNNVGGGDMDEVNRAVNAPTLVPAFCSISILGV